ncbi:FtsK/SpoIIIE domain-containing protein [Allonocardiopsis opalescens]|uniref:S-DNA-T family DNA segregation ATPase FtsK/SpoIIIE n=1 Tax=Allonocardiopsis opalescens TaxID=1144618 RepID=A0A2T0PPS0_9ACTN|nr:FtsK/SpoIIIE domain-containing protein [Allonocardiopsis opalescens]PRX90808.1 S-DNA-T family DNA segregation ATPase FtsK/SpoIIIE [Allonocardiopsis opalescens]
MALLSHRPEESGEVERKVFDGEIVDEAPTDTVRVDEVRVDAPEVLDDTGSWVARRRALLADAPPIIPPYLRTREQLEETARWAVAYYAHVGAFHATRSPFYMLRLMARSPRGAGRLIGRWVAWVADAQAAPVHAKVAASGDVQAWLVLSREHSRRVKPRRITSAVVAVPVALAMLTAVLVMPAWVSGLGVWLLLCLLGLAGGDPDRPLIARYVAAQLQRPLASPEIEAALEAIGIKGKVDFVEQIAVDGPGWRAELDLPPGVLAERLLDKRKELAGAMRRPLQCVWPSVGSEHPSRAVLWVAKRDPRTIKRAWPLLADGQADMYAAFPFGVTPRGETVPLTLIGTNVLIGGVMGSGKTSAVLVIALAGALDPTCQLWLFELKGSGDMESVQPVAHRYVQGDDDEHCHAALDAMYALEAELKRRKKIVAALPVEDVPTGRKVTRALADKYPHLDLDPILAIFDEVHTVFEHPEVGKEAAEVAGRLIRKARAYGIILVLTTQKPDGDSIPKMVSDNAIVRFCLAITGHIANDLVLGTGMYKRGIRANIFEPAEGDDPKDSGTGWLTRSATSAKIVRAYFIGQADARAVGRRALALRTAAGTLTGEAAGRTVEPVVRETIADHLHAVWPEGADRVHSHRLVEALAAYRPELYAPWLEEDDPAARSTTLAAALKPHRIPTHQLTIRDCCGGAKGVRHQDLPPAKTPADDDE